MKKKERHRAAGHSDALPRRITECIERITGRYKHACSRTSATHVNEVELVPLLLGVPRAGTIKPEHCLHNELSLSLSLCLYTRVCIKLPGSPK